LPEDELSGALIVDGDPEHVAREEITCKLHAPEVAADRACECSGEGRLADARDVLDEQVPASEKRDEGELDGFLLALESSFDGLA
jgi:hypothetical protein